MLIERYVTTEILRPFAGGLGILVAVFVAFTSAVKLTDAAAGEIAPAVVARLIALSTLISLEVLVPTTLYLAILFALGRLHRDAEMAALAAAGIGEARILRAVLGLGLLTAMLVATLSVYARPWAYARSYALEQQTISRLDLGNIRPGSFVDLGSDGYVLHAREVDPQAQELRGVFVQRERPRYVQVISAARARIHGADAEGSRAVEFMDGHSYLLDRKAGRDVDMRFNSFLVRFPEEERITRYRRKAVDTASLAESEQPKDIAEFQWRITAPLATLLLALLAVPLSRSGPRQSRSGIFAVAMLAYLLLFTATGVVRNWVESAALPPFPGLIIAYLPTLALLIVMLAAPRLRLARWRS